MAAMRAGDVIIAPQRFADSDGDCFFADVKMRKARHHRARIQLIHLFFEEPNPLHVAIHAQQ